MEIEKELRLPEGFKSWWDLVRSVPYQDEIALMNREPDSRIQIVSSRQTTSHNFYVPEVFEADVLTLKVRAFDELKEIIPDKRVLMEAYHALNRSNMGYHKESLDFIEKLINLM